MRPPPDARYVVVRIPSSGNLPRRIGVVIGAKVYMKYTPGWWVAGKYQSFHPKGRLLADVEVLRDATPREVAVGMALH